jgi:putative hydrolase of the HAD superfamily
LALRGVVFDYGMVLTGPPDKAAHDALLRMTGLTAEGLDRYYWTDRHAYDAGTLTGLQFWEKLCADAGLGRSAAEIAELDRWDARMWTTHDPAMVKWAAQLKQHGLKTAVLSNMGDSVHASILREFPWLRDFDALVWSYELGVIKPDAQIYRHTLERLGLRAEEALFLDDKAVNVEAARALGMKGLVFSTVEKLRADLVADGMEKELPLPG